ncbi:outer membrane beta-barrel protein [Joostella atrarenae]|uniref:Outer membrane beta-barrel protein n=1 Tax=Joostella atrarenae TaxID=679257 RepID=A0ABS9J3E2_9FLAO|nr:CsgG/HfaB family protein [Joostella atrarenae]MCF8714951.1 outer membrane beta-barrel protein [Joostella atrarenae]
MINRILTGISLLFITGCGTYFNQPVDFTDARIGENTAATKRLTNLPEPESKVVVGVYNFRDLTGQYKQTEIGSTFSTAVTQGGTAILINALEDSGWFTPIERENIGNLLNERNIIRSTRQEYQGQQDGNPGVPPLLFAGILLEGGIVSYDSNIITGGMGARYFGVGGSTQYRQDRVTIYLRAISTSNGKILKNIYVSKTILSQALDASLFKYVKFQRLLEAEVGFTRNEPIQLAVTEAIEKAVEGLVLEGMEADLWHAKDGVAEENALLTAYQEEKEEASLTKLYNRKYIDRQYSHSLGLSFGASLNNGDYGNAEVRPVFRFDYKYRASRYLSLNLNANTFELNNGDLFSRKFASVDTNLGLTILPNDDLTPFIYGGPGILFGFDDDDTPENSESTFFKIQYGLGLEYFINQKFSIKLFAEQNMTFSDNLDYIENGNRDDYYYNFGLGVNFTLGVKNKFQSTK